MKPWWSIPLLVLIKGQRMKSWSSYILPFEIVDEQIIKCHYGAGCKYNKTMLGLKKKDL